MEECRGQRAWQRGSSTYIMGTLRQRGVLRQLAHRTVNSPHNVHPRHIGTWVLLPRLNYKSSSVEDLRCGLVRAHIEERHGLTAMCIRHNASCPQKEAQRGSRSASSRRRWWKARMCPHCFARLIGKGGGGCGSCGNPRSVSTRTYTVRAQKV